MSRLVEEKYITPQSSLLTWERAMEDDHSSLMVLKQKPDQSKTEGELLRELVLVMRQGSVRFGSKRRRKMMYDDPSTIED